MENAIDWTRFTIGLSGVAGVAMLIVSFAINTPPPSGASAAEMVAWSGQHFAPGLWGAWLQAVGPVLIVLFAFSLVHLAGAAQSLSGWMTFLGAMILMTVSLIEITFYVGAWFPDPQLMPLISLRFIAAAQHLYFIVAAPSLFLPLGIVVFRSRALPRAFAYTAFLLAAIFAGLGAALMLTLSLPGWVTAFAGVQALWWLAAAITMIIRSVHPVALRQ
jgi:hypothetical protein